MFPEARPLFENETDGKKFSVHMYIRFEPYGKFEKFQLKGNIILQILRGNSF